MSSAVELRTLLELAWAAPLAVLVVTLGWGLVIRGTSRASEARRAGRGSAAAAHMLVAVLGGTLFAVTVISGLIIMAQK
ncbi:MAG: hypothetical protein M3296_06130 [Actinomycetota bacterium]|nr:hypothetical protein [Actinomycetota bacterium]